jgi:hypothetical protein
MVLETTSRSRGERSPGAWQGWKVELKEEEAVLKEGREKLKRASLRGPRDGRTAAMRK